MKIEWKVGMWKHFELVIRLACTANADLFGNRTTNILLCSHVPWYLITLKKICVPWDYFIGCLDRDVGSGGLREDVLPHTFKTKLLKWSFNTSRHQLATTAYNISLLPIRGTSKCLLMSTSHLRICICIISKIFVTMILQNNLWYKND